MKKKKTRSVYGAPTIGGKNPWKKIRRGGGGMEKMSHWYIVASAAGRGGNTRGHYTV